MTPDHNHGAEWAQQQIADEIDRAANDNRPRRMTALTWCLIAACAWVLTGLAIAIGRYL